MSDVLARPGLDFGLATDHEAERRAFYEDLGLKHLMTDHLMPGQDEVYYTLHGSWLKIVTSDQPMKQGISGYSELLFVDPDAQFPRRLTDPDGIKVTVVPKGYRGIDEVGVVVRVHDRAAQVRMLIEGMHAEPVDGGFVVGNTVFFLEDIDAPLETTPMFSRGFTMVTLVLRNIAETHEALIKAGATNGLRICDDPVEPGRCRFSFVRDPNGNWIELVQFAELSSPLSPAAVPPVTPEEFLRFRDDGIPA
jgi:catechol 2,3-dioxygenase-like lactoylglutathione lyase family enzyme